MNRNEIREMMEHPHTKNRIREGLFSKEDIALAFRMAGASLLTILFCLFVYGLFEAARIYQRGIDHSRYMEHLESLRQE